MGEGLNSRGEGLNSREEGVYADECNQRGNKGEGQGRGKVVGNYIEFPTGILFFFLDFVYHLSFVN